MANKRLFGGRATAVLPSNMVNEAGGRAYSFTDEQALCQYVVTGTFNQTYYTSAEEQLDKVKALLNGVSSEFIAKAAVYGHQEGKMKDIPAYLLAVLAARGELDLLRASWSRVITNPKMLYNFVQIVRSGETGRKSFGSAVKRLIADWITSRDGNKLFLASIGHSNPSLTDVIKMVHPRPQDEQQDALFAYLLGKPYDADLLPSKVLDFELFKGATSHRDVPDLDYRALTNCNLTERHWKQIARNMPWNTLRINLNVLSKNGVFKDEGLTTELAAKLGSADEVRKWNAFPYQIMTTYQYTVNQVPREISLALQDALETATENVPNFGEKVAVAIDISGSMQSPATGYRQGATTNTTCADIAALVGACILRQNSSANVFGWDTSIYKTNLNPRDSVLTNAQNLKCHGGGTDASVALRHLNQQDWRGNLIVYVSDNQSWYNPTSTDYSVYRYVRRNGTYMSGEWSRFKERNPKAKLVCIDVQPYPNSQVPDNKDVLNIGGFSDNVFKVIDRFVRRGDTSFVDEVNQIEV